MRAFGVVVRAVLALLAAALGLLAMTVAAPPAIADDDQGSSQTSDEQALAEKFAPMVHLVDQPESCGPGEPFEPSDVDPLLGNDSIALRGPWTQQDLIEIAPTAEDLTKPLYGYSLDSPGNPLKPGCDYEKWADRVWAGSPPTVYAHVATQQDRPGELAVQYWFYYPYNDFNNKHEGDWERIQLEFEASTAAEAIDTTPVRAVYSQHEGAESANWGDDPMELDGTHPAVYVSAGSHASRYSSGLFLLRSHSQGFGCDMTLDAERGVLPTVKTIPSDPAEAKQDFPWISYQGTWGQQESVSFYSGPTGPSTKSQWTKPFTWSDNASDTSYEVPGGSVYGVKTTTFFCSIVGHGSILLLNFTNDPLPVLLGLAVLLAFVVWLVRRASWEDSTPLPAMQKRGFGETAAVAWEMYRHHLGLFLCIGSAVAAVSLVSGIGQQFVAGSLDDAGDASTAQAIAGIVGSVALLLTVFFAASATAWSVGELDAGRTPRARDAYRHAYSRAGQLLVTLLVAAVPVVPLLLTLYLAPLVVLLVAAWALLVPVVQLEQRVGLDALRRSWQLVRHQVFKVVGLLLFGLLLITFFGGLVGSLVLVAAQVPFLIVNLLPGLINALVGPFVTLMMTYSYFHGRAVEAAAAEPVLEDAPA